VLIISEAMFHCLELEMAKLNWSDDKQTEVQAQQEKCTLSHCIEKFRP